jgi:glutathionylspermidine synthase
MILEPPWKALLSNRGILPLLWEMFPNHPNLLPAYFEDDPDAARLGSSFVRKPLYSREGANIALISGGMTLLENKGPTARKVLFIRPWHRCRFFPANVPCLAAG